MKVIPEGTTHCETVMPNPGHLASALGNHGVDVVSTPSLILFFEAAANNLAAGYYEPDEVSVGTHVNIDHLAPANGSEPVDIVATLTHQKGRRLEFSLTAHQAGTLVMRGEHYRAVVPRGDFSAPNANPGEKRVVEFWFDFHSPWCYFASHQIGEIARQANVTLQWKPVHLANLNVAVDGRRPLESNPNFVAWYQQDIADTAELMQLPIDPHTRYPIGPSRALRAAIYAEEQGLAEPFVIKVMQGYWAGQKDISDIDWLVAGAEEVGLDGARVRAVVRETEFKQKLNDHLQQAIDRRFFGLPVAYVDRKIFWGNDRLPLLAHYLQRK